jgi:hypothetical protein
MRTTLVLPPELMKQAKALAAARGESLRTLLTRAVFSELSKALHDREKGSRVQLPLFGAAKGKSINISGENLAGALTRDDVVLARRANRAKK